MPSLVRVSDLDDPCSDLRVVRPDRRLGLAGSCSRRGLFKQAMQIKHGELFLLFGLP